MRHADRRLAEVNLLAGQVGGLPVELGRASRRVLWSLRELGKRLTEELPLHHRPAPLVDFVAINTHIQPVPAGRLGTDGQFLYTI